MTFLVQFTYGANGENGHCGQFVIRLSYGVGV